MSDLVCRIWGYEMRRFYADEVNNSLSARGWDYQPVGPDKVLWPAKKGKAWFFSSIPRGRRAESYDFPHSKWKF